MAEAIGLNLLDFTFDDYRWAVSTVMTRQNMVPIKPEYDKWVRALTRETLNGPYQGLGGGRAHAGACATVGHDEPRQCQGLEEDTPWAGHC